MELWDIYDENRIRTGQTAERGAQMPAGGYHIIVHVALINSRGQMLIQKRHAAKRGWPGLWDISAGGCAVAGENSRQAASRELLEELGVDDEGRMYRILTVEFEGGFDDIYVLKKDLEPDSFTLQEEEVSEVKWADESEIAELIEGGAFVPYHKSHLTLIFDMALRPADFGGSAGKSGTCRGIRVEKTFE